MSNSPFAFPNEQRNQTPPSVTVATIADLRALLPGQAGAANVGGSKSIGDGGGGVFVWNPTDTRQDNGTTIIASITSPGIGRWNLSASQSSNISTGDVTITSGVSAIQEIQGRPLGSTSTSRSFLRTSDDSLSVTYARLRGMDLPIDLGNVLAVTYGADPTGAAPSQSQISDAFAASPGVTYGAGTYLISVSSTLGSSTSVHIFNPGAKIKPANGQAVTIAGRIIADVGQVIFDLSAGGSVVFSANGPHASHPAWFGSICDGSSDDTPGVKAAAAAIASAGGELHFVRRGAPYRLNDAVDIASNIALHLDADIVQHTAGKHLFTATSQSNIRIRGSGALFGVGGAAFSSSEMCIKLTSCTNVEIEPLVISSFKGHGLYLIGCTKVKVHAPDISGIAGGLRLRGCDDVTIIAAGLSAPSSPSSTFMGGIFLDSTDGHPYGWNTNIRIIACHVKNYVNAQNIEVHAGENISIVGNVTDDASIGVSVNPLGGTYATTATSFTQPAALGTVSVQVDTTTLVVPGQTIKIVGGGFYKVATITDGTHFVLQNTGDFRNASPASTIGGGARVMPGDSCRNINIVGHVYRGTNTTGGGPNGNFGISIQGDPDNLIENVLIDAPALDNANAVGQASGFPGAAIYLQYCKGVSIPGVSIDRPYGSGIWIGAGVSGLVGGIWNIRNVQPGGGRQEGVLNDQAGATGYVAVLNVDSGGAGRAVRYDAASPGLIFERIIANVATRIGSQTSGRADGVGGYPGGNPGPSTVDVSGGVSYVLIVNSGATTISNLTGGIIGQEVTLEFADGHTTVNRSNATLSGNIDFVSSANATLTLRFNGTLWQEIGRAPTPVPSQIGATIGYLSGSSAPNGNVSATPGTVYAWTGVGAGDSRMLWAKETGSGNTGWVPLSVGGFGSYTPGATTVDVTGVAYLRVANSGAVTITNFTGGINGQRLLVTFADANTTIDRSHSLLLGGANFTSTTNSSIELTYDSSISLWIETNRSATAS